MTTDKADIFTVRPRGETPTESRNIIEEELKTAGLDSARIVEGSTQPDGSTLFYVYLKK